MSPETPSRLTPLAPLLAWQVQMGRAVGCRPLAHPREMLGGLGVAYRRDGTEVGAAVLAALDHRGR